MLQSADSGLSFPQSLLIAAELARKGAVARNLGSESVSGQGGAGGGYATLRSSMRGRLDASCPGTTKSESGTVRNVRQGIETSKKFGVFSCPASARRHAGFRDSDGKWGQLWGQVPMPRSVLPPMRLGDVSIGKADRPIKPTLG